MNYHRSTQISNIRRAKAARKQEWARSMAFMLFGAALGLMLTWGLLK